MRHVWLAVLLAFIFGAAHLTAAGIEAKTGFINVGDTELYYEEMGTGHPLIMIHGGFLDARMWDDQFQVFSQKFRVIRYDARNHGRSKTPAGAFSHYEDLKKVMDELGIRKAAVMGLSMGGYIAIDFALAYPDRVSALVLAGPGLTGFKFESELMKQNTALINKAIQERDLKMLVEYFQQAWTDGPHRRPTEVSPAVREKVRQMAAGTLQAWNEKSQEKRLDPPAVGRLAEIRVPTLVIVGSLDMPDILDIADLIKRDVKGSKKVIIKEAAHMVNMEKPGEFNRTALDFLAQ